MSDKEIRDVQGAYERDLAAMTEELRKRRAADLNRALTSGRTRAQLMQVLGVSRNGLHQMLDPEAARTAAEKKRASRERLASKGSDPRNAQTDLT
ncbi:hypothetical protein EDD29_0037 [Actinocorallia herbida]|uniref:Uncharacterized protein n=2 Tax=Actinocorallia herbida TaxID=58109 RepID=A0A3N1CML1_9ACTN|nr:hypothetical protein EDD29_0037 [Actinocorallia herbida]